MGAGVVLPLPIEKPSSWLASKCRERYKVYTKILIEDRGSRSLVLSGRCWSFTLQSFVFAKVSVMRPIVGQRINRCLLLALALCLGVESASASKDSVPDWVRAAAQ